MNFPINFEERCIRVALEVTLNISCSKIDRKIQLSLLGKASPLFFLAESTTLICNNLTLFCSYSQKVELHNCLKKFSISNLKIYSDTDPSLNCEMKISVDLYTVTNLAFLRTHFHPTQNAKISSIKKCPVLVS